MKYLRYPAYKDSGIEWIGEIPEHWKLTKLKNVCHFNYGDSLPAEHRLEGKFPVFGSNGIIGYNNLTNTGSPTIIIGRKGSYGKLVYSSLSGFAIDTTFYVNEKIAKVNLKWLYYALMVLNLDTISLDTGVPGLSREDAYEKIIVLPNNEEQFSISNFLDSKTKKIDALITKHHNMIELLKEKRQAIITSAVTKGLDPNVPMKDSGIKWIGEIPEHWKLSRIKFVSEVTMGQSPPSDSYLDHGKLPFLQGCAEFGENFPNPKNYCEIATKISYPGDILLSVRAPVGELNLSDRVYGIGRGLCSIRPLRTGVDYLKWYLLAVKNNLISLSNGSTYDAVTISEVKNLEIPISEDKFEQNTISEYVNTVTTKIDILISKHLRLIDFLKEYKTSLVTQVVTGKIDVRGFAVSSTSNNV